MLSACVQVPVSLRLTTKHRVFNVEKGGTKKEREPWKIGVAAEAAAFRRNEWPVSNSRENWNGKKGKSWSVADDDNPVAYTIRFLCSHIGPLKRGIYTIVFLIYAIVMNITRTEAFEWIFNRSLITGRSLKAVRIEGIWHDNWWITKSLREIRMLT